MFRRKEDTIGDDAVYPAELKALGFFINDLGQIRMIEAPEKYYVYHATNNERVNEMRRESMQECSRQETEKRLSLLGINRIYLPEFTETKPNGPHVPILAPAPEILKTRKRVIVIVNDAIQDIGILAYRQMQRDLGLNGGSVVNLVKELIKRSASGDAAEKYQDIFMDGFKLEDHADTIALVVLNTAQLLYSHKHNKALTMRSWSALPRKSISHDMIRIHEEENSVPGHRDPKQHVQSVFDTIICNPERVAADAEIYVIALESGTETLLRILEEDFEKYAPRIKALALIHSLIDDSQIHNPSLRAFLHKRAREWRYSDLTTDPQQCTELPDNYSSQAPAPGEKEKEVTEHIAWNEDIANNKGKDGAASALSNIINALHRLAVTVAPTSILSKEPEPPIISTDDELWSAGQSALCPTFAGGPEISGECILTNPLVQSCVLSFFEAVARDPQNYRNPDFRTYVQAHVPMPTPDHPLALDPNVEVEEFSALPEEVGKTVEEIAVDEARETLEHMQSALTACPPNIPGRNKLIERIAKQSAKLEALERKALAMGGLGAGVAPALREKENKGIWKPEKKGVQVEFAGTMVDSELLKAAGLIDTADEQLGKLGE